MLTLSGYQKRIGQILEATNHDDNIADILDDISKHVSETDEVIREMAANYPEEDEIFDFEKKDTGGDWKTKYNDLVDKYNKRFFRNDQSGDTTAISDVAGAEQASSGMDTKDDKLEEEEQKGIDSLFEEED